ncbi:MAG: hypothetical protein ACM3ON_12885, partial [Chloroflexota bacterium]
MIRAIPILAFTILLVASCARTDTDSSKKSAAHGKSATEKPLIIGLIPEQQIFAQVERYQPLADYLSGKIGQKIKFTILPRYGNIIDSFVSAQM